MRKYYYIVKFSTGQQENVAAYNEVEAIIQDIVNDFSKEKIINYANGKKGDNYVR